MRSLSPLRHLSWALLAAGGLTACGGEATLLPDRGTYAPGDTVELRLRNGAMESLQHGPLECAHLEASEGPGWVEVMPLEARACPLSLAYLAGLSEASASVRLRSPLPPGTYRFRTTVEWAGAREQVHSPPFEVRGVPPQATP